MEAHGPERDEFRANKRIPKGDGRCFSLRDFRLSFTGMGFMQTVTIGGIALILAMAGITVLLSLRMRSKARHRACAYCGKHLYQQPYLQDAAQGMPRIFCDTTCRDHYRERSPQKQPAA